MPLAAVITLIATALTVLVLAAYLISVALVLKRIDSRLRAVAGGLHVVTEKTEPVGSIVGDINNELNGVDTSLRRVLAK